MASQLRAGLRDDTILTGDTTSGPAFQNGSLFGMARKTHGLMTQNSEYELSGCRIQWPPPCTCVCRMLVMGGKLPGCEALDLCYYTG